MSWLCLIRPGVKVFLIPMLQQNLFWVTYLSRWVCWHTLFLALSLSMNLRRHPEPPDFPLRGGLRASRCLGTSSFIFSHTTVEKIELSGFQLSCIKIKFMPQKCSTVSLGDRIRNYKSWQSLNGRDENCEVFVVVIVCFSFWGLQGYTLECWGAPGPLECHPFSLSCLKSLIIKLIALIMQRCC